MDIKLRELQEKDAERMLEWMHDAEVTKYLRINGNGATLESSLAFIQNSRQDQLNKHYAIADATDNYLGTISLKELDAEKKEAELAIVLHGSASGKGIGGKAIDILLEKSRNELLLDRVYLNVLRENERAKKLYEKVGFELYDTTIMMIDEQEHLLDWYEYKL